MKKYILLPVFILFISFSVSGQAIELPEEVRDAAQLRVEKGISPSIVIGIVDKYGERFYSFGKASLDTNEMAGEHTLYEIGSISKTFTSLMLAEMAVKGKLNLEDPIAGYLPEGIKSPTKDGKEINFIHLATHTSGLPRLPDNLEFSNPLNPYADYTIEQLFDFLNEYELQRAIGETYEYSNYAIGLLGQLLAEHYNTTFGSLLHEMITSELGMDETMILLDEISVKKMADPYSNGQKVSLWDLPSLAGAGGIRSTASDMLKYLAANIGLSQTALSEAIELTHIERFDQIPGGTSIGLGWHMYTSEGKEIITHSGGTGGFRTFAGFVKSDSIGVIVLSNSDTGVDDIGIRLLDGKFPLQKHLPSIAGPFRETLSKEGIEAAVQRYYQFKNEHGEEYNFDEAELNILGYEFLQRGKIEIAIAIFKLNVETFPDGFNTYDSLGEAYMENGDTLLAIDNYSKSLELNPGNENGREMLVKLGVNPDSLIPEISISDEVVESYVGKYELSPVFHIVVSLDGNQLMGQATGQPAFEMFPKSETEFYLKVVEASITFHLSDEGEVESMTLHQNGQHIPGKKIE